MSQDILGALKHCELFRELDSRALTAVAAHARWLELPSGAFVYRRGESGDALYLIANGRVSVALADEQGVEQVVAHLGLYELVGEMAVLTGERRSATVRAVRDCALVCISKQDFESLLSTQPKAMFNVVRQIVLRLRRPRTTRARDTLSSTRNIAVLPAHPGAPVQAVAQVLSDVLNGYQPTLLLDAAGVDTAMGPGAALSAFGSDTGAGGVSRWLNGLEAQYRYLVYVGSENGDAWTRRCLRQADRILVVADGDREPEHSVAAALLREEQILAPVELALVSEPENLISGRVAQWLNHLSASFRHIVSPQLDAAALAAVARRLTGRAIGLVLGGGGARGFAHLGLLRALHERNMPIDLIGGSSMGALVSALCAMGHDYETLLGCMRMLFVENNNLNDFSLSRVSLIRARKLHKRLEELFGDRMIEDLPLPFYCMSTNLSRSRAVVHDRGRVVEWVGASMAVPGIAPPIVWKGDLLVDGALVNAVPSDVMAGFGRGPVIASDVSSDEQMRVKNVSDVPQFLERTPGEEQRFNLFNILFQTATMTGEEVTASRVRNADLYLRMPVRDIGMFDWQEFDRIIYRGYVHASEQLDLALEQGKLRV